MIQGEGATNTGVLRNGFRGFFMMRGCLGRCQANGQAASYNAGGDFGAGPTPLVNFYPAVFNFLIDANRQQLLLGAHCDDRSVGHVRVHRAFCSGTLAALQKTPCSSPLPDSFWHDRSLGHVHPGVTLL